MDCKDLSAKIRERTTGEPPVQVAYPEVTGLFPPEKAQRLKQVPAIINLKIAQTVKQMSRKMGAGQPNLVEMIGTYQIPLNQKGVLSIKLENFSFLEMQAHPWQIMAGLTFDLTTGQTADLVSLFKRGSNYRLLISQEIKRQIQARELPLIAEFKGINDDQEFYLTEKALVVFFQRATLAPAVAGIVEFPISYHLLTNLADPKGLLGRIMAHCHNSQ